MAEGVKSQKVVIPRNNTSFSLRLFEFFRKATWDSKYDFLKYYQNLVRLYVTDVDSGSRGILASLEMGLGKSILAVSIAMDMIGTRQPIVLLTKSLQENMRGAIRKYVRMRAKHDPEWPIGQMEDAELDRWLDKTFRFVSMNASNMLAQMNRAAEGHAADDFNAALERKFGEITAMASLNGKLLIVDEAHNFFRAVTNGSKNAIGLYDMVMRARDLKLVFLTGTPVANDPFELAPCFNMLAGHAVLPESYKEFNKLFVAEGRIKNKTRFQNRLLGMVSHVSIRSRPGAAFGVAETSRPEFPEQLPLSIERIHMDDDQYVMYGLARDQELDEGGRRSGPFGGPTGRPAPEPASMTKPKSGAASTYRVKSRQLGNWSGNGKTPADVAVGQLGSAKYRRIVEIIDARPGQLGMVYSQFVGVGGLGTFSRFLESRGWKRFQPPDAKSLRGKVTVTIESSGDVEPDIGDDGLVEADGTPDAVELVADGTPDAVGSGSSAPPSVDEYLASLESATPSPWWTGGDDAGGDDSVADSDDTTTAADLFDESRTGGAGDEVADRTFAERTFAIISGDVPTIVRQYIQDVLSEPTNMHGGIIDLVLLSSTGAEGLDLKNMRYGIIMEPHWGWGRAKQIFARGVRNDSHIALPESERNFAPYICLAIPPEAYRGPSVDGAPGVMPETTDTELFNDSLVEQLKIDSFVEATHEISIECLANDESYCRKCSPTNAALFTDDIARDVASADPCVAMQEKKVTAESITVDGVEYYFTRDEAALYDWRIYKRDPSIDGFRPMSDADPLMSIIAAAIEARV